MERRLSHLNWMEIRDRQAAGQKRVLLPVGSLEAHGALAQGTDLVAPTYLCGRLAEPLDAWVAPCIPYGVTRSLAAYPGTVHISGPAFSAYVGEVLRSFARQGFTEILVVNGHGGHSALLREVAGEVHEATGARIAVIDWWSACYDLCELHLGVPGGHAGVDEAAVVMAVDPALVFPERQQDVVGAVYHPGVTAIPVPGSLLSQSEAGLAPIPEPARAAAYVEAAVERLRRALEDILRGWSGIAG